MEANEDIKVVHMGRSGYVEFRGARYTIGMEQNGGFSILFPDGNRRSDLQEHLNALKDYCKTRDPEWIVENHSRNYK